MSERKAWWERLQVNAMFLWVAGIATISGGYAFAINITSLNTKITTLERTFAEYQRTTTITTEARLQDMREDFKKDLQEAINAGRSERTLLSATTRANDDKHSEEIRGLRTAVEMLTREQTRTATQTENIRDILREILLRSAPIPPNAAPFRRNGDDISEWLFDHPLEAHLPVPVFPNPPVPLEPPATVELQVLPRPFREARR